MKKLNVFIVIPTIRNLNFLRYWKTQFKDCTLLICEDHLKKSIKVPKVGKQQFHYSWQEIDQELGDKSWIIPRKVSAIRSYGFYKAYQMGVDVVITLDDDCYPVKNHSLVKLHLQNLSMNIPQRWTNTYPDARFLYTRGMPYLNRQECPVRLSHGLWTNILDFDAPTHLQHLHFKAKYNQHFLQIIPKSTYFPMCSMNLAFAREIIPLMYFPLMGEDKQGNKWGYNRFDDIWCGLFAKKIMDHLSFGVLNGIPLIEHRKASDMFKNLENEALGIKMNELVWQLVDEVNLTKKTVIDCYIELATKIKFPKESYFEKLKKAMLIWITLFD